MTTNKQQKVYVINKSGHDFSPAKEYGELVFLSKGMVDKYDTNQMYRQFRKELKDSNPEDYILETSLTTLNVVACSLFAYKHGRLNLLLFKNGRYVERTIMLGQLVDRKE